jgi:hypothetical protein
MDQNGKHVDGTDAPQRKPYEKPAIIETSAFETLALQCGQLTFEQCDVEAQNS